MLEKEILSVNEFLASLRVANPQSHKNLTVLPLVSDKTRDLNLKTLEEALGSDKIEVTEVDNGGSVPKLKFVNKGDEAVLILQGAIIKGNLQDRAIRHTFIVYPHAVVEADVFCVEAARWRFIREQKKAFKPAHHLSADIRMDFFKDSQGSVWEKIEEKRRRMGVKSHTGSADHIYEAYQKKLEEYKRAFVIKPELAGMMGVIEGKTVAMDISGIKGIFQRQFPDLVTSFVIDALDKAYCEDIRKRKDMTPEKFLRAILKAKKAERNAIGGKGIEVDGEGVVGEALVDHDLVVQMEVFAN